MTEKTAPKPTATGTTGGSVSTKGSAELVSSGGRTSIADTVVSKIAGIAAREVNGVVDLGGSGARMVGKVREVIPGGQQSISQGVTVEVGERQAAVDLGLVAEYGVAIHELAAAVRQNVQQAIERMTGLEVTEVNITVHDVKFGDEDETEPSEPRVQ